jgi:hypothetical protein
MLRFALGKYSFVSCAVDVSSLLGRELWFSRLTFSQIPNKVIYLGLDIKVI